MKDNNTHITNTLEQSAPKLSPGAKEMLWSKISSQLSAPAPVSSPYQYSFISTRWFAPVALSLVLVLGVGGMGTVAAAEQSKPGDLLYPLERAVESFQLFLASDARSSELQAEFARKRLLELRAIIDEELVALGNASSSSSGRTASTTDMVDISASENIRINFAVSEFIRQLENIENEDARRAVLSLIAETDGIDVGEEDEVRVRIEDDKVEFRFEDDETGERIRIREKKGEVRIEVKSDDEDDRDSDDDSRRNDSPSTPSRIIDEAEADVIGMSTTVKVELRNGNKFTFTTSATTRAGVVTEIVSKTGATTAEVDAVLDFEIKDSDSRNDDQAESRDDENRDSDDRDDDSQNRSNDEDDGADQQMNDGDSDSNERIQIEARVKDNRAEVRVEQGSKRDEFTLNYVSKSTLILDIVARTGLSATEVSSVLDLEIDD